MFCFSTTIHLSTKSNTLYSKSLFITIGVYADELKKYVIQLSLNIEVSLTLSLKLSYDEQQIFPLLRFLHENG